MMNGLAWAMRISCDFIIAIARYFSSYYIPGVDFYPSQDYCRRGTVGCGYWRSSLESLRLYSFTCSHVAWRARPWHW